MIPGFKLKMSMSFRITAVLIGLAGIALLVFSVFIGSRPNKTVEEFIKSPGVIEQFDREKNVSRTKQSQESPLVKEARALAVYLNPPPPPPSPPGTTGVSGVPIPPKPKITPKFTLVGTTFFPSRPSESIALIDEPGKGLKWIRQSSKIEHLVIDQIRDGAIVIRDGDNTTEMKSPPQQIRNSLLKSKPSQEASQGSKTAAVAAATPLPAMPATTPTPVESAAATPLPAMPATTPTPVESAAVPPPPAPVEESPEEKAAREKEIAAMQKFMQELTAKSESEQGPPDMNQEKIAEKMTQIKKNLDTAKVSTQEANNLDQLGQHLKQAQQIKPDPNQGSKLRQNSRTYRRPPRNQSNPPSNK